MPKNTLNDSEKDKKNKSKFFKESKQECMGISQTTTVTVNIDQKEDCFSRFMNALCSCGKTLK